MCEKSFVIHLHDFDIYTSGNPTPITGQSITQEGKLIDGNKYELSIDSNNIQQDDVSLLEDLTFTWCFGESDDVSRGDTEGTSLKISGSGLSGTLIRHWNAEEPNVTVLISDGDSEIGKIWYTTKATKL